MLLVSVAQLKAHLRIDGSDEDELLEQYIEAAQGEAETRLRRPIYSADADTNPARMRTPIRSPQTRRQFRRR